MSAPNGNTTTYGYDDAGAATSKTTTGTGGTARAAYSWTRNQAGQLLSEASTISGDPANGTVTYAYDQLGRLTGYTPPSGTTTTYGWEAVPNRASVTVGANPAVTTSYDAANRPINDSSGGTYSHDDDGRLTARPGQTLAWNALGQLTSVTDTSTSDTTTYTYDALDRLHTVDDGTTVTRLRYVGRTTTIAELVDDGTGSVLRSIATDWTGERLVDWTGTNSNQRFYGTNGHHDVTWTADDTGAVTNRLRYDPWGTAVSTSGSSLPDFRFQGSWHDATTNLAWVVTRWYAPAQGRFISQDSLLGEPASPPSRHLYAYGEGEPVGRWDPLGLFWYRVLLGEDLRDISLKVYRTYLKYPAIQQANGIDGYAVSAGRCIWIPDVKRTDQCTPAKSTRIPYASNLIDFRWSFKRLFTPKVQFNVGPLGVVFVRTYGEYAITVGHGSPNAPSITATRTGVTINNRVSTFSISAAGPTVVTGGQPIRLSSSTRRFGIGDRLPGKVVSRGVVGIE